jgi:hypothetical protein
MTGKQGFQRLLFEHTAEVLALGCMMLLMITQAKAQTPPENVSPPSNITHSASNAEATPLIEIKIETSRSKPTVGTGLGVIAEVKNTSSSTVYLHEKHITLSLPIEMLDASDPKEVDSWWAFFPSEPETEGREDQYIDYIALQPGDTYKVLWTYRRRVTETTAANTNPVTTNKLTTLESKFLEVLDIS